MGAHKTSARIQGAESARRHQGAPMPWASPLLVSGATLTDEDLILPCFAVEPVCNDQGASLEREVYVSIKAVVVQLEQAGIPVEEHLAPCSLLSLALLCPVDFVNTTERHRLQYPPKISHHPPRRTCEIDSSDAATVEGSHGPIRLNCNSLLQDVEAPFHGFPRRQPISTTCSQSIEKIDCIGVGQYTDHCLAVPRRRVVVLIDTPKCPLERPRDCVERTAGLEGSERIILIRHNANRSRFQYLMWRIAGDSIYLRQTAARVAFYRKLVPYQWRSTTKDCAARTYTRGFETLIPARPYSTHSQILSVSAWPLESRP